MFWLKKLLTDASFIKSWMETGGGRIMGIQREKLPYPLPLKDLRAADDFEKYLSDPMRCSALAKAQIVRNYLIFISLFIDLFYVMWTLFLSCSFKCSRSFHEYCYIRCVQFVTVIIKFSHNFLTPQIIEELSNTPWALHMLEKQIFHQVVTSQKTKIHVGLPNRSCVTSKYQPG